ncbi:MAG: TIR domain-containing protein [Oscillospiraceae bacterium]|jgi:hypothetical protein|nr:TIR domain-containing protein [Oscillospiraceae bacterium]
MAKRIFISFAIEDENLRNMLVGQARNDNSPFAFVDMSVKQPWDHAWKTQCRTKIKGCNGVIAIATNNSRSADGQIWEINCAREEGIPVCGVWGHSNQTPTIKAMDGVRTVYWTWDNIKNWLATL